MSSIVVSQGAAAARRQRPQARRPRPQRRQRATQLQPRRRAQTRRTRSAVDPLVAAYANTLTNPFQYGPVKVGFGTLCPTDTITLIARGNYTAGADGGLTVALIPAGATSNAALYATGGIAYSTATAGTVATFSYTPWQNLAPYGTAADEARVVSGGIRAYPNIPGTSAPGTAYVVSSPSIAQGNLEGIARSTLIASPLVVWGSAVNGASATTRPIDPNSFIFHHNNVVDKPIGEDFTVTGPILAFTGLPAGYSIIVEAVLNVEYIRSVYNSATGFSASGTGQGTNNVPTLAHKFANVEAMWTAIQSKIPLPTSVHVGDSLANAIFSRQTGDQSLARRTERRVPRGRAAAYLSALEPSLR